MKLNIYTVYDEKATAYLQPFFQPNDAMAIRIMENTLMNAESMFANHPEDYTLYKIGEFDDNDAKIDFEKTLVLGLLELKARLTANEISNEAPILPGAKSSNSA